MKDILLYGGLGLAGYLIFRQFENQQASSMASNLVNNASNTAANNPVASPSPNYPPGWITPAVQQELVAAAIEPSNYARDYVVSGGNLPFWQWAQMYRLVFGYPTNAQPLDIHAPGDGNTVQLSVGEFAQIVNQQLNPLLANSQAQGLGVLAITGNIAPSLQNRYLPNNLELFNAFIR